MYYADLPLSDVVFLPIVCTIWTSLARILHQKTMYSCVLSCWRLRQGARHITGFGQEFVLPTNEQAHDLAEAEGLKRFEQPHWVRPIALELRALRNCHSQTPLDHRGNPPREVTLPRPNLEIGAA
jgi:hypothetical protein